MLDMKHHYRYFTLLILALVMPLTGCQKSEDLIFDKHPEARALDLIEAAKANLTTAEHGWQMDYKTGSDLTFRFQMQFGTDGYVKMFSDFEKESVTSTFSYNLNRGAVLSFDSYGLIHKLADPTYISPASKGKKGTGYLGDFEFIIDRVTTDSIFMRGFKHNKTVILTRLTQAPDVHYDQTLVDTLKERLTKGAGKHKTVDKAGTSIAGLTITQAKMRTIYSCIFDQFSITIVQKGEGEELEKTTHSTKNTVDGIELMPEVKIGELTLKAFKWDAQRQLFVSAEHSDITININSAAGYK